MADIKALIVDDEKRSRNSLEKLIQNFCEGVEILGKAESVDQAILMIEKLNPEVVFLDIQMPGKDGFELLNQYENIPFKIIFTTAYDEYAIKAIRWSALDYLLKPIDIDELQKAIARVENLKTNPSTDQKDLIEEIKEGKQSDSVVISINSGYKFIKLEDIIRFEASGNYTYVFLKDESKILGTKSISEFNEILDEGFFRLHRSHIINLAYVDEFRKGRSGSVLMQDGAEISIARDRKSTFLSLFNK